METESNKRHKNRLESWLVKGEKMDQEKTSIETKYQDIGKKETEKLANYFGETIQSRREKRLILEKEIEKKEKRQKVGEMVKRWEKEKRNDFNGGSRKLNGPGGEIGQHGGGDGEVPGDPVHP